MKTTRTDAHVLAAFLKSHLESPRGSHNKSEFSHVMNSLDLAGYHTLAEMFWKHVTMPSVYENYWGDEVGNLIADMRKMVSKEEQRIADLEDALVYLLDEYQYQNGYDEIYETALEVLQRK